MDNLSQNALRRARRTAGITQEKAAEMSGYSVDAIQAWEAGTRRCAVEALDTLAVCYDAPWLAGMYLRELSRGSVQASMPEFEPGKPLPQAVLNLLDKVTAFGRSHADQRLVSLAADGRIDVNERQEYDAIMEDLQDICRAAMELKFCKSEDDEQC